MVIAFVLLTLVLLVVFALYRVYVESEGDLPSRHPTSQARHDTRKPGYPRPQKH
jgi:hypothetical protein